MSKISDEACQCMEEEITLVELKATADALGKKKIPRRDGTPVEFYL